MLNQGQLPSTSNIPESNSVAVGNIFRQALPARNHVLKRVEVACK
jgi:hypothetical protein